MMPDYAGLQISLSTVCTLGETLKVILPLCEDSKLSDDARFAAITICDTLFDQILGVLNDMRRAFPAYIEPEE